MYNPDLCERPMRFEILCDRLMHNYLRKKLNGQPLTVADPVGNYIYLMAQTARRGDVNRADGFVLPYAVELDEIHGSRKENLLSAQEVQMVRTWTKYLLLCELKARLDSDACEEYNAEFEAFQEEYDLCDLDISRDEMYKWYERIHSGFTKHRFVTEQPWKNLAWPGGGVLPDHLG